MTDEDWQALEELCLECETKAEAFNLYRQISGCTSPYARLQVDSLWDKKFQNNS